jgi:AraC-like DNA-binding protein
MTTINQIGFEDVIAHINYIGHTGFSLYQDKIIISDVDNRKLAGANHQSVNSLLWKLNAFYLIFVEHGEVVINIDYRPFRIGANMAVILRDMHIIQFVSMSDDFRSYNSLFSADYLRNVVKDMQMPIPDVSPAPFFSNPVIQLEPEEFIILRGNLERLRRNIHRNDHIYWHELVQNESANLFYEIRNIALLKLGRNPQKQTPTRREQVIAGFLKLLLECSRTEREVVFYADKLCVTPVYLSRLIKRTIGKPAINLIHEMAITDAMSLLRKPDMTIQDAADIMNFPDRETFSKFFKKVAGESPGNYMKKKTSR